MEEQNKPQIQRQPTDYNDKRQPYEFTWGHDLKGELWIVNYENYRLEIDCTHLLITSKLRDGKSSMRMTLTGYALEIDIQGRIPFTLAVYRKGECLISWSESGSVKFEDLDPENDTVALIPWTFFVKDMMKTSFSTNLPKNLGEFLSRVKSHNLLAGIVENKSSDSK